MGTARQPILTPAHVWIGLLGWIVVGGALAQGLAIAGAVGPYCEPPPEVQDIYPVCEPCALRWGAFGIIDITPCPNPILRSLSLAFIEIPHVVVVVFTLLVYPIEESLRKISIFLPALALVAPLVAGVAWTVYVDFVKRRRFVRGIHRALLIGLAMLVVSFAMKWGGAWPWKPG